MGFISDVLLTIESKEKPRNLESEVGIQLKKYIEYLMGFKSSVYRSLDDKIWKIGTEEVSYNKYTVLSVGAFITNDNFDNGDFERIFRSSMCDMLIGMKPFEDNNSWEILMRGSNINADKVIDFIVNNIRNSSSSFNSSIFKLK